jgi:hypothetical protein
MKQRGDERSSTAVAETIEARKIVAGEKKSCPVKDVPDVDRSILECEFLFNDDRPTDAGFYQ